MMIQLLPDTRTRRYYSSKHIAIYVLPTLTKHKKTTLSPDSKILLLVVSS